MAERLSFTRAAESLYLTQPAVTLHIKKLEEDLDVRLFDRSGGRISLTPAGRVLLDYSLRIAALYEEARRAIGQVTEKAKGTLRLGASTTIAQYILPRLLRGFLMRQPGVGVSVVSGNTERIAALVAEGKIEIGLIEGPAGRSDVKTLPMLPDELVVIVPQAHEWAGLSKPLPLAQLVQAPLILRELGSGTRVVVENALREAGISLDSLQIALELDSTEGIKSAVECGLGIGIVSEWALHRGAEHLARVEVESLRITRELQFVYASGPVPSGLPGLLIGFASMDVST